MPLFRCDECGCIENTALGCYWARDSNIFPPEFRGKKLCSEHGPKVYSDGTPTEFGTWHGQFPQRSAAGMQIDQEGFLWSKDQVEKGALPPRYRIIGEVPA